MITAEIHTSAPNFFIELFDVPILSLESGSTNESFLKSTELLSFLITVTH